MMADEREIKEEAPSWPDLIWKISRWPVFLLSLIVMTVVYLFVLFVVLIDSSPMLIALWLGVVVLVMGLVLPIVPAWIADRGRPAVVGLILFGIAYLPTYFLIYVDPLDDSLGPMSSAVSPSIVGILLAGLIWLVFGGCLFSQKPVRVSRAGRFAVVMGLVIYFVWVVLLYRMVVWDETPDPLPRGAHPALVKAVGNPARPDVQFYYFVPSKPMFESSYLWRLDAPEPVLKQLIIDLNMRPTGIPNLNFWRMTPGYWPRSIPVGGRVYLSHDGITEFNRYDNEITLVYDPEKSRVYVWERMYY